METIIYNIDSNLRNKTSFPNSHNFTYNTTDGTIDTVNTVVPFSEKNVISLNISSIEIPNTFYFLDSSKVNTTFDIDSSTITIANGSYTRANLITTINALLTDIILSLDTNNNKVTITNNKGSNIEIDWSNTGDYLSLGEILGFSKSSTLTVNSGGGTSVGGNVMKNPQEEYVFLKLNDLGNIRHKNKIYASKILLDSTLFSTTREHRLEHISKEIKFNQPQDINYLNIGLYDYNNNLISLNGDNFSFTLEVNKVSNSVLKQYNEVSFYDDNLMTKVLHSKMLQYYEKNTNNTHTQNFNKNISTMNNNSEFNPLGNRKNYF